MGLKSVLIGRNLKKAIDISCIQVEINILLHTFCSRSARTWLNCKNKGVFGYFCTTFQLLVKSTYINVLSALKKQASLNLSLNSQIKVESVKYTIFKAILPHTKGLDTIGVI